MVVPKIAEKLVVQTPSKVSAPVLVVGSVAFDNIITPVRTGERILGGAASFASLAASYFAPVRLVGVVGNDFEDSFIERFRKRGIDLEGLQVDASGPTFFWAGKYHEDFNNRETLETQLNVFEHFRPELPQSYRRSPYLMLANIGPGLQIHVLDQLKGRCFVVADTMNLWINNERDELLKLLRRVDCLAINDSESFMLTGDRNLVSAGWKLLDLGPRMAIIKKGENGACLFHRDGYFALPAYPVVNLQDPTGAGDAFGGALTGYLAAVDKTDFKSIKKGMFYATAIASLTVEAFSCDRLESAGPALVEERYRELLQITAP